MPARIGFCRAAPYFHAALPENCRSCFCARIAACSPSTSRSTSPSTPGAAVLATAGLAGGFSMAEAVGAFLVCGALITLAGVTGWFERVMNRIPMAIASALLAGVLARFGLQAFAAAQTALALVLLMLATYLLGKRFAPRYAVVATLAVAVAYAAASGGMVWSRVTLDFAVPVFT
eukprot:gene46530-56977_t